MKYDFDRVVDRRGTFSIKWEVEPGELPMWVADMDFQTAPQIMDAMRKRLEHGVYGYTDVPKEWNDAYINWWRDRHHIQIENDWIMFCTGVIPAISSTVRKLTTPGENVLVMTPVYNTFYNSILNNGRNVLECPLVYENHKYHIDYADLEKKLANPQTSLMILCNPHNPVGKIWDKETLAHIGELCAKHHVLVLSEEIHCDLTMPGFEYTPFASVNETCRDNSITCIAPTKTFNMAGIQTAAIVVPNPYLRHKVWRAINTDEVAEPNVFAVTAAIAAFTQGGEWLDQLREYINQGKTIVKEYFAKELPQIQVVSEDATYLLWLDCSAVTSDSQEFADSIRKNTGLFLTGGYQYRGNGDSFVRLNIACAHSVIEDGLRRFKKGVEIYQGKAPAVIHASSVYNTPAEPEKKESTSVYEEEKQEEFQLDAGLLAFLEADSYEKKLEILNNLHATITDSMIDTMAVSLDIEVKDGDIEQRYQEVLNCLLTMERFECNRLR